MAKQRVDQMGLRVKENMPGRMMIDTTTRVHAPRGGAGNLVTVGYFEDGRLFWRRGRLVDRGRKGEI